MYVRLFWRSLSIYLSPRDRPREFIRPKKDFGRKIIMAAPKETSSAEFSPSDPSDSRNSTSSLILPVLAALTRISLDLLALFPRAPEPKTELGRYRILSPTAGVRVSPICLGSMSVGDQWTSFMGGKAMDQAQSEEYLDEF